ncbi:hypothetical protein [Synechococcus sp. MIT S9508]|uniref:hypothetical protein n=1 Tax=Synechococcus sp. MIT S9508 TaxID=1801629 RepID=UPI0007BC06F5|nr:hypothetical protein [Synechococcus sp. MIT S9508]KZR88735.1 hypothetical protein MITS9508_01912 [Synechococcus sp. MIT S9508]
MKPFFTLLTASALGIGFSCPSAIQASPLIDEVLLAQMAWDDEVEEIDAEPVDRSQIKDGSGKNTWIPTGFNENKVAVMWIRVSTYKPLNENSFRFRSKFTTEKGQVEGKLDINCKNKDFYFRPTGVSIRNAPWAVIPKGSGIESVALLYCKRTAAKEDWGFTPETAFLWDAPIPTTPPDMASGEWINHYDKPDGESYYNDGVKKDGNVIQFAMYYRTTKGDMSVKNRDEAKYEWIRTSCERNIGSTYAQLDQSVPGVWMPPTPGAPGGAIMLVRKKFCK